MGGWGWGRAGAHHTSKPGQEVLHSQISSTSLGWATPLPCHCRRDLPTLKEVKEKEREDQGQAQDITAGALGVQWLGNAIV